MNATSVTGTLSSTKTSFKERLRAGGIHLLISGLVALASAALIFLVWYPAPLAVAQGVDGLVLMMIQIDVVLGPILTVAVFQRNKTSLKFDLGVIGGLQACALLYGLHTIFIARPVLIAYNIDRFDVVSAVDVNKDSLAKSIAAGKPGLSLFGPRTVVAFNPVDRKEMDDLLTESIRGGSDLPQLPHLQVPYDEGKSTVIKMIKPMARLKAISGMSDAEWGEFSASIGHASEGIGWVPVRTKAKDAAAILDRATGDLIAIKIVDSFGKPGS